MIRFFCSKASKCLINCATFVILQKIIYSRIEFENLSTKPHERNKHISKISKNSIMNHDSGS